MVARFPARMGIVLLYDLVGECGFTYLESSDWERIVGRTYDVLDPSSAAGPSPKRYACAGVS